MKLQNGGMDGTREAMNTGSEHQMEEFSFNNTTAFPFLTILFYRVKEEVHGETSRRGG